jgi:hypothetical protein
MFGRPWPIAETKELIQRRWEKMLDESGESRAKHFKNNKYRKIERQYRHHITGDLLPTLKSMKANAPAPKTSPYAFRSYDRHFAIEDIRFNDRMGEVLWRLQGPAQLYLTALAAAPLGTGQGIIASAAVPDKHHFRGSFGGKDVIPVYLDAGATKPNVTAGLLDALGTQYGTTPSAEDLVAYVYAVLGGQSYTRRFWSELETPGPRVPLTKQAKVFTETAELGRKLIWLHTYAERLRGEGRGNEVPAGDAKIIKGVSDKPTDYPEDYGFDSAKCEITVGDGKFGPVTAAVWEFEVSGLKVVQSWLAYRMKKRAGKKSSPLDSIRPERWTPRMSEELLELLWVLDATLALEPALEAQLDQVVAGPCFTAKELPEPTDGERKAPNSGSNAAGGLLGLMGVESDDDETENEDNGGDADDDGGEDDDD